MWTMVYGLQSICSPEMNSWLPLQWEQHGCLARRIRSRMEMEEVRGNLGEDPGDFPVSFVYGTLTNCSMETAWSSDALWEDTSATEWICSRFQPIIWCQVDSVGETAEHDEFTCIFLEPWEWKDIKFQYLTSACSHLLVYTGRVRLYFICHTL